MEGRGSHILAINHKETANLISLIMSQAHNSSRQRGKGKSKLMQIAFRSFCKGALNLTDLPGDTKQKKCLVRNQAWDNFPCEI